MFRRTSTLPRPRVGELERRRQHGTVEGSAKPCRERVEPESSDADTDGWPCSRSLRTSLRMNPGLRR